MSQHLRQVHRTHFHKVTSSHDAQPSAMLPAYRLLARLHRTQLQENSRAQRSRVQKYVGRAAVEVEQCDFFEEHFVLETGTVRFTAEIHPASSENDAKRIVKEFLSIAASTSFQVLRAFDIELSRAGIEKLLQIYCANYQ